jgi:integrase
MSSQLCGTLKAYQVGCKKKGLGLGLGSLPEYVFTNKAGNLIDLDGWRIRVFNKAPEKAELRKIRVHDLRHTYATIRISEGHDIIDVSHQLGHHSEAFALKPHHHWKPGKRKSEVDALDDQKKQVTLAEPKRPVAPQAHPVTLEKEKWVAGSQLTH